jgi:hypothetical protein
MTPNEEVRKKSLAEFTTGDVGGSGGGIPKDAKRDARRGRLA